MFINQDLGFAALARSDGSEANLFRTTDGGLSFEQVELPTVAIEHNDLAYAPYDFPQMPYYEKGHLILYVGQGTDGDSEINARAMFTSKDNGKTFDFQKIEE